MAGSDKLSIIIKALLESTQADVKEQISKIQAVVNGQDPVKLAVKLDTNAITEIKQASQKANEILDNAPTKGFTEAFGIKDKKTLKELAEMAREYQTSVDGISKEYISGAILDKVIESMKSFKISIGDTKSEYEDFVKWVNTSKIRMEPFGSDYEDMRRSIGVKVVSSKSGLPMDSWYQEARGEFPHLLPDAANVEDQFQNLYEALQRAREKLKNDKITGNDIIELYGGREEIENGLESLLGGLSSISAEATKFTENIDAAADSAKSLNDAKITIKAVLEATDSDIKHQLAQIQQLVHNQEPIKIPVEIDDEKVKRLSEQLEHVTKKSRPVKLFEFEDAEIDSYKEKLSSVTKIFTGMADEGKKASAIITEQSDGLGKTVTITNNLNKKTGEYETSLTRVKDNYKEQLKILDDFTASRSKALNSVDIEVSKAFNNTSKPLKLDENITTAKKEAEELKKAINLIYDTAASDKRGLFKSESAEINNLIKNYKNLIGIMQTQERAATKLRTKTVEEIMGTEPESLSRMESKMKLNKAATDELTASFERLKASMGGVKTNEQFVDYSIQKDKLEAQINAEISSRRLTEQQNKETESVRNFVEIYSEKVRVLQQTNAALLNDNPGLKDQLDGFTSNLNSLDNTGGMNNLRQQFTALTNGIRLANQEFNLDISIEKAKQKMDEFLVKFSAVKGNPELMRQFNELEMRLGAVDSKADMKKWQAEWTKFGVEVERSGLKVKSFGDQIANAAKKFGLWLSATTIVMGVVRNMRQAVQTIVEMDTALTNLSKVTEITRSDFQQLGIEALSFASKYGRSVKDALDAQVTFARAGFANYQELAEISLVAQAAGQLTEELASKYLIASDKAFGFGGSIEKLFGLLDQQNQLINRNAVTLQFLAEATQTAGNIMVQAGESIESASAAWVAIGVATQKSGSEIARSTRTIQLRLQQVKQAFQGLQTEVDGEIINAAELSNAAKALEEIGFQVIRMENGVETFATMTEVAIFLADALDKGKISATELNKVVDALAGQRQSEAYIYRLLNVNPIAQGCAA